MHALTQHVTAWHNVLMPVNYCRPKHYAMLHVHTPSRTITCYDSMAHSGNMQDAMRRAKAWLQRMTHVQGAALDEAWDLRVCPRMPQQEDLTSCGVLMACAGLAILRALRDGGDTRQPTLDFDETQVDDLRVHMACRLAQATPMLRNQENPS